MRLLLDTHALLCFYLGDARLSDKAQAAIVDPDNPKLVSPASFWEIAIKLSIGTYVLNVPYENFIKEAILDNGFEILPIEPRHTAALVALPFHSPSRSLRICRSSAWIRSSTHILSRAYGD